MSRAVSEEWHWCRCADLDESQLEQKKKEKRNRWGIIHQTLAQNLCMYGKVNMTMVDSLLARDICDDPCADSVKGEMMLLTVLDE